MVCATWEFDAEKTVRVDWVLNMEKKPIRTFKLLTV